MHLTGWTSRPRKCSPQRDIFIPKGPRDSFPKTPRSLGLFLNVLKSEDLLPERAHNLEEIGPLDLAVDRGRAPLPPFLCQRSFPECLDKLRHAQFLTLIRHRP